MARRYLLTITVIISCNILAFAQSEQASYSKLPSISLGVGTLSYFGDLSQNSDISTLSQIRTGYHLNVEKRFGNFIGVSFQGLMGELSYNQRTVESNLNFETSIMQAGLNLVAYIDNDKIINRKSLFTPFFSVGVGYMMFEPKGDMNDANGNPYYYWNDGSIRDLPQADTALLSSKIIQRDYTYETALKDSANQYAHNTITIPLSAGLKFKLSNSFDVNIAASYNLTQTDFIDNTKGENNKNDNFLYTSFSIQYNLGYGNKQDERYKSVDFGKLDKVDYDGDGVPDFNDRCQNTPKGVKTDSKGCPIDNDGDGVPDYLDKEPNTASGAMVDATGATLTDEMIATQSRKDSLATERNNVFKENPSLMTLREIDAENAAKRTSGGSTSSLPREFQSADLNKDGYISADEITAAIDNFFEGESDFTVERLHKIIDFFFEQ